MRRRRRERFAFEASERAPKSSTSMFLIINREMFLAKI